MKVTFIGGAGTGGGITKVADSAARLALSPSDGTVVIQLDTDTLYQYDGTTSAWKIIGASSVPVSVSDTNSINATLAANVLSADLNLSAAAASASNKIVALDIQADGLRAQIANEDIQDAAHGAMSNTDSVTLTYNDGANTVKADLRVSPNAADAGSTLVALDVQSTGTPGLRAQVSNSLIRALVSATGTGLSYNSSTGVFTFDQTALDHGTIGGLSDDDHAQYHLLAGRAGGQTLKGGTASGENMTLMSTNHATKGKILFGTSGYDEANNRLGIGNSSPNVGLDISKDIGIRASAVATAGTLSDLSTSDVSLIRLSAATVLNSLANPTDGKLVFVMNANTSALSITNDSGGTAANRILTGTGADVNIYPGAMAVFQYDSTSTRWRMIFGGQGGNYVNAVQSISASGTISIASAQRQIAYVQGNAAAVTASAATPIANGSVDGQELTIIGRSDTNTVTLSTSGNLVLNGSSMTLGNQDALNLIWDNSNTKWLEISRR